MNLKIKNTTGITLDGNKLSGNTFGVKDYIKAYLGGKWNSESKTWTVDVDKINRLMATPGAYVQIDDNPEATQTKTTSQSWCHNTKYGRELNEDY